MIIIYSTRNANLHAEIILQNRPTGIFSALSYKDLTTLDCSNWLPSVATFHIGGSYATYRELLGIEN